MIHLPHAVLRAAIPAFALVSGAWAQSVPVFDSVSALRQTVNVGQPASFTAIVTSATPVTYQWKRNGIAISGATSSAYAIASTTLVRDSGYYQLVATNSAGVAISRPMFLNVAVTTPEVIVWGDNSKGQANVPRGLTGVSAISAGFWHTLALLADGTVIAWGANDTGQTTVPAGLNNVVAIAAGNAGSLALKADGTVVGWGNRTPPAGLTGVVAIAADYAYLALRADGTVVAWGDSSQGQTNVPPSLNGVVAITVGGTNSLALKADGTVVGWGSNIYGQTNIPADLSGVVALAVSDRGFALKSDQSVMIWGAGLNVGQTKMPADVGGVSAIAARSVGNLILTSFNTVAGWGGPPVPSTLTRVMAIAMGDTHSVALRDVSNATAPVITTQPVGRTGVGPGEAVTFSVNATTGGAGAVTYQWRRNGVAIAGATGATYTVATPALAAGSYDVLVSNYLGTTTSVAAVLTVAQAPRIVTQPASLAADAGEPALFSVAASGSPLSYQWQKNGVSIAGATNATYAIAALQAADAGTYACLVINAAGVALSASAELTVLPSCRLANVSVRATLAAAQTLTIGLVVRGGAKNTLIRAAGPSLGAFGLPGAMTDPRLELYKDSTKVLENDNWPGILADTFTGVGAFSFTANSRDAALLESLNGNYSAVVSGTGAGIVLVEAYDAGTGNLARLINLSARHRVGTGADILIAGFSLAGRGTKRVLLRAVGPTIGGVPFNVADTLVDPKLELYDANGGKIAENDNWDSALAPVFSTAGAFPLAANSRDAALVVTLAAGSSYSVQVKGADGGTGEALVEIYELP